MDLVLDNGVITSAAGAPPGKRARLLASLVDFCRSRADLPILAAPGVQAMLSATFLSLAVDADAETRRWLSEQVATAAWTPAALARRLALDDISIARPMLAASPVLREADLLEIVGRTTPDHQAQIARRTGLGRAVIAALLDADCPRVLTALIANASARLEASSLSRLAEQARWMPGLRAPLARREELTADIAQVLYTYCGQSVRQTLSGRFRLADETRAAEMPCATVVQFPQARDAMDRRLVEKLHAAGQLGPALLLNALRDGRLELFLAGLSALGGIEAWRLRSALDSNQPELLARACAAAGMDRSLFATILRHVRDANGGRPSGPQSELHVADAFSTPPASSAFRKVAQAV